MTENKLSPAVIDELEAIVGEQYVLNSPEDLVAYSYDSTFTSARPNLVVLPGSTQEASKVLEVANRELIPIVPRGMGTGLSAGSIPFGGGIVLPLTRMDRLLDIDLDNMMATAEAGIITSELADALARKGYFYPPDPSSDHYSTLGGNAACNAGGAHCLKYGITGHYVVALEVVLADGRIMRVGGKATKNVTGYDLVHLLIGSEGTLAIITEVTVRFITPPETERTAEAIFPKLADAGKAINAVLSSGAKPSMLEIMDETSIKSVEDYLHLGLPLDVEAILVIQTDGDEAEAVRGIEIVAEVCRQNGARDVRVAATPEESAEMWHARHSISGSLGRIRPNKLGEDITVPHSVIPRLITRIKEISARWNLPIVIFGHAGDGNLHPNILFDKRDPEEYERVEGAVGDLFRVAVELGGSLSGEHGVGVLKRPYLEMALGPVAVEMQKRIKQAWDPNNILNPGKIFV
ncbi:MAG: glycolate oxidase subunit GlcD [Chloroflexi bacterium]|nr:MAG: glycolate oxidase subunit GlcD [Chloroflexota bacterium]